jgi:uncharacterized protein (UPF0332 family)
MDAGDFLVVADKPSLAATEADWRSAVSRAYYAAFHVARGLLASCRFKIPRSEKAHVFLAFRLSNSGDPTVQSAGDNLDLLRTERNRADYELSYFYSQAQASAQVRIAEDVVRILKVAALEPLKTQITDAIKIYERDVLKDVTWQP